MRFYAVIAFAAALATSVSPAKAQSAVQTGVLECHGRTTSYILASVTPLECIYNSNLGGGGFAYAGEIRLFGVDIGFNQSTVVKWAVFAPTRRIGPGDIGGHYVGASANATVVVGVGANALWGGSSNTVALQPLSLQAQTGLSAAGGISSLDLVPVRPIRRGHRRHRH
jgi:hypothetical protein